MLVLTRKLNDRVLLQYPDGTAVWVTLIEIDRGRIRLGFDAPPDVKIYREELLPRGQADG